MKLTVLEIAIENVDQCLNSEDVKAMLGDLLEAEKDKAQRYAEFAIRCDRMGLKILNFEDWIKL